MNVYRKHIHDDSMLCFVIFYRNNLKSERNIYNFY